MIALKKKQFRHPFGENEKWVLFVESGRDVYDGPGVIINRSLRRDFDVGTG